MHTLVKGTIGDKKCTFLGLFENLDRHLRTSNEDWKYLLK